MDEVVKTDCVVCTGEKVVGEDTVCINCGATDGVPTAHFAGVLAADEVPAPVAVETEEVESPKADGGDEEPASLDGSEADQVTDAVAE